MNAFDFIRIARDAGAKLSADGPSLVVEAENPPTPQLFDMLRAHKPEILELLHAERRAVVRYVNDQFQTSPLGQCAHAGVAVARAILSWRCSSVRTAPTFMPRAIRHGSPRRKQRPVSRSELMHKFLSALNAIPRLPNCGRKVCRSQTSPTAAAYRNRRPRTD